MVGLFRNHLGRDRNEPIVRVGNIAAIPADPIRTRLFGDMRAILIEARSIGGLSGSPVFVHLGFVRWRDGKVMFSQAAQPFLFLGLMHGHWEVLEAAGVAPLEDAPEKINTGIAIVVPAEQIRDSRLPHVEEIAQMTAEQMRERGAVAAPPKS